MRASKHRWVNATTKIILAMLAGSLLLSSCGGDAEPADSDTSLAPATPSSWSPDEFEDLVAYCDTIFGDSSSSDPAVGGIGPIEVDCRVVVRQNLDELGCPVEGTYEVLEETRRLIGLDIEFDNEVHSSAEAWDWGLLMQSELDDVYARVGCEKSLTLSW
jgi:hypothetical protein